MSVSTYPARAVGGVDARYMTTRGRATSVALATGVYRNVLSRSLYSRCRMFPSDSELFDRRARTCGATVGAVLGASRLLLETEASPEILPVTFADGRLRWFDNGAPTACAP